MAYLYKNDIDSSDMFIYATELTSTIDCPEKLTLKHDIAGDSITVIRMGVPDGIGPQINEALLSEPTIRRLYIYILQGF